jgi:hypothetical protein
MYSVREAVPASLVAPVVLLMSKIRYVKIEIMSFVVKALIINTLV